MKFFTKLSLIAAAAAMTINASAQSIGEDCGCPDLASRTVVNMSSLTDANGNLTPGTPTILTCDNLYKIDEVVYVPANAQLFIEPGTVLKGQPGQGENANALVVSRDGQIFANGTDCCPIIFTAEADPVDGSYAVSNLGDWGGVIILGNARNNLLAADGGLAVADGVGTIEGLLESPENFYGGTNDDDNSGVMRYVSIRHGGTDIGEGNEINGLTLGSVGRGTTLEYIEVISNNDDGIEFFGGTVDLKYATVMFCGDDYFDWDQGWSGRGQFWYGVQLSTPDLGDEGLEVDGDDSDNGAMPFSNPNVYNVTLIGNGDRAIYAKESTRGNISNSIFSGFSAGIGLATEADRGTDDAFYNFQNETLTFSNNCFDVASLLQTDISNSTPPSGSDDTTPTAQEVADTEAALAAAGNTVVPGVIDATFTFDAASNTATGSLNPVPTVDVSSPQTPPTDGFFEGVAFKGAFKPGATAWTSGWTVAQGLDGFDASVISCPEDINKDGEVDINDFLQFQPKFNTSCAQ